MLTLQCNVFICQTGLLYNYITNKLLDVALCYADSHTSSILIVRQKVYDQNICPLASEVTLDKINQHNLLNI